MKVVTKLNNIQILRAFAAISVVYYHTGFRLWSLQPFGSYGVAVFFVISGFIMARILDPENDSSEFFIRRRLLRIVPPYWFFTLLLFGFLQLAPQYMHSDRTSGANLLKSMFFVPYAQSSGLIQPVLFLGWTLNHEMFFYLALAIGLYVWKRKAVWMGAAIVLIAMAACVPFSQNSILARFYSRSISLEFLLGILSYYLCCYISEQKAKQCRILTLIVCLASAFVLIYVQAIVPEMSVIASLNPVIVQGIPSFFLVTGACILSRGEWDAKCAWIVLIGDASYVLYLIHPYCELFIDRIIGAHSNWLRIDTALGAIIGIIISVIMAVLFHLCVERPFVRFLNSRYGGKRISIEVSPQLHIESIQSSEVSAI